MRASLLVLSLLCIASTAPAQIKLAPDQPIPTFQKRMRGRADIRLADYPRSQLSAADGYGAYLRRPDDEQLYVGVYAETDIVISEVPFRGKPKKGVAHGPAWYARPDGTQLTYGTYRDGRAAGEWFRVTFDTLSYEACFYPEPTDPIAEVVERLRTCFPDTAVQRRIKFWRQPYRDGQREGLSVESRLDGLTLREQPFRADELYGEEVQYDKVGELSLRIEHGGKGRLDTTFVKTGDGPRDTLAHMPLFRSPECPTFAEGQTEAERTAVQRCAERAMLNYIYRNVKYPQSARIQGYQGKIVVAFVIDKEGSVERPHLVQHLSRSLDAEALRVVRAMPKWHPGELDGEPVRVSFVLPIMFQLE